jgi:hypothetical protein
LQTSFNNKNWTILAFVNTFNQNLKYLAPHIARIFVKETINSKILQITLALFLFYTILQVFSNKLLQNKKLLGNVYSILKKV